MIIAPLPVDEAERLAELQALQILDTPKEARFDRIVELASRVFATPIAYVAMIDSDRQWFKSACGINQPETSRSTSFCSYTILQTTPLVVDDALLDPRFCDNPLVIGDPHIRFYAGHPLAGPGGRNVGTLCLADRTPRSLDDAQLQILARFAAMIEHELGMVDLIRTQREVLETKTQLLEAQANLARELAEAEAYVRSQLPAPLKGPIRTDWQFVCSSKLGGDFLGYRWLDDRRLAIYLLDVTGHGVGAALLSTSVESMLRGGALGNLAYNDPAALLEVLNRAFPMQQNDDRFFSMWYGVYDTRDRSLVYANAGHPPPLLFDGSRVSRLEATGTMVGAFPDSQFQANRMVIPHPARLYLYSDGAYEVTTPDGGMLQVDDLQAMIERTAAADGSQTAEILKLIREAHGKMELDDDLSILGVSFD
jgi:sigma-B regulation protein RsbU (phosphoserine phosphatase)